MHQHPTPSRGSGLSPKCLEQENDLLFVSPALPSPNRAGRQVAMGEVPVHRANLRHHLKQIGSHSQVNYCLHT